MLVAVLSIGTIAAMFLMGYDQGYGNGYDKGSMTAAALSARCPAIVAAPAPSAPSKL